MTSQSKPKRDSVDDVGFILGVVDRIATKLPVNPNRVYVAGFSAGARMAYHVACRAAPRIAAIAVLSGSIRDDRCHAARSVPLIAFHGTADNKVAYNESPDTPPLPLAAQKLIFPLLLFGFGILVSLWPFHTWAPLGYCSAPAPTAKTNATCSAHKAENPFPGTIRSRPKTAPSLAVHCSIQNTGS